jgi:hypothetical protein
MESQVSYSAVVVIEESAQVNLYSYFLGGKWMWYGYMLNVVNHDELGCKVFENAGPVDCGTMYFDYSEGAIVHAVAQFDVTEGGAPSVGLGSADNLIGVEDAVTAHVHGYCNSDSCNYCLSGLDPDDYPGDVLTTGWDAADHKAMYE